MNWWLIGGVAYIAVVLLFFKLFIINAGPAPEHDEPNRNEPDPCPYCAAGMKPLKTSFGQYHKIDGKLTACMAHEYMRQFMEKRRAGDSAEV